MKPKLGLTLLTLSLLSLSACGANKMGLEDSAALLPKVPVSRVKALFPQTVGQGKPLIVDFSSAFCMACQQIEPKLKAIVKAHPTLTLQQVDIAHLQPQDKPMAHDLNVTTAPQVFFITGQGVITRQFLDDTPQAELEQAALTLLPKKTAAAHAS